MDVKKIAVIGSGLMGAGIAYVSAWNGYEVTMVDIKQEFVDKGLESIRGDVLTGIIAGLWGQQLSALEAAVCGVSVHGLAGDLAADELTERGMIASDLNGFLSAAFKYIERFETGEQ